MDIQNLDFVNGLLRKYPDECDRVDYKTDWPSSSKRIDVVKDVVAFVNTTHHGTCYIVYGVSDVDHRILGVNVNDGTRRLTIEQVQELLCQHQVDGRVVASLSMKHCTDDGVECDVLVIPDYVNVPVFYKDTSNKRNKASFLAPIRVGAHKVTLAADNNDGATSFLNVGRSSILHQLFMKSERLDLPIDERLLWYLSDFTHWISYGAVDRVDSLKWGLDGRDVVSQGYVYDLDPRYTIDYAYKLSSGISLRHPYLSAFSKHDGAIALKVSGTTLWSFDCECYDLDSDMLVPFLNVKDKRILVNGQYVNVRLVNGGTPVAGDMFMTQRIFELNIVKRIANVVLYHAVDYNTNPYTDYRIFSSILFGNTGEDVSNKVSSALSDQAVLSEYNMSDSELYDIHKYDDVSNGLPFSKESDDCKCWAAMLRSHVINAALDSTGENGRLLQNVSMLNQDAMLSDAERAQLLDNIKKGSRDDK